MTTTPSGWPPPPSPTWPPPEVPGPTPGFEPGTWRLSRALGPVVVLLASYILAVILIVITVPLMSDDLAGALAVAAAGLAILLGGAALWRGLPGDEQGRVFLRPGPWPATLVWGLVCGFVLLLVSGLIMLAGMEIDPSMADRLEDAQVDLGLGVWPKTLALVALVVLAPLGEELLFRGLLLRGLAARMGFWRAAALSSVVFGLAHLDVWVSGLWVRAVALTVVGVGLCLIYRRWGYWGSVTAHATVNAVAAVALLAQS